MGMHSFSAPLPPLGGGRGWVRVGPETAGPGTSLTVLSGHIRDTFRHPLTLPALRAGSLPLPAWRCEGR